MDFFTAVHHGDQPPPPTDAHDVAVFANAVASRHGTDDHANILRTRLTPVTEMPMPMPESPMANMSLASTAPPAFNPVLVSSLAEYINDPHTLIVDIRPHAAYTDARLPRALSLSVPSTLLKRPLFSLERLAAMLPSPSDRARFSAFRQSNRILVYDADAAFIPESSNIHGLLRKFKAASYPGELSWLRGGFQGVWREQHHLVDTGPQPKDHDDDDDQDSGPAHPSSPTPPTVLRTKHLPMSAFSLSSTTASQSPTGLKRRPPFAHQHSSMPMHMSLPMPTSQPTARPAINPFFDTIRQNIELSHGITERIPLRLPARVRRRIADLPFPWLQEIAKRADRTPHVYRPRHRPYPRPSPKRGLPPYLAHSTRSHPPTSSSSSSSSSDSESTDSDAALSSAFIEEGAEALAMQFYRIELAEQRRLMGVMEHHSKESGRFVVDGVYEETHASLTFPFSITAGVEKGAKNRYRHIWPFEHARVRLHTTGLKQGTHKGKGKDGAMTEEDDYVNASYVQPIGTNRRYIATQGPLEATFDDFWRLIWEQNVHVIVMLTKEIEGSMVKCGAYWADTKHLEHERTFGPLRLTLVSKIGLPPGVDLMHGDPESVHIPTQDGAGAGPGGFAFPPQGLPAGHKRKSRKRRVTTIKRTFSLTHVGYPHLGARTVVQLQYLDWPDMNVPEDARGVLGLVKEVESAVRETDACASPVPASPELENVEGYGGKERKGKKEMQTDPGSGIARHALGGCRPVLLHCSAGVGRTGGFIAVDAVLDAVRREMRLEREMKKETAKEKEREMKEYAAAMDVDEPARIVSPARQDNGRVVTVPLQVSANTDSGMDAGGKVDIRKGLVVHVPAVVVPSSGALPATVGVPNVDALRTPMQVDGDEASLDSEEADVRPTALTREWAESVSGSYIFAGASRTASGSSVLPPLSASPPPPPSSYLSSTVLVSSPVPGPRHPQPQSQQRHRFPPTNVSSALTSSASSSSVSAFPSISDSEDSAGMRPMRGGSGSGLGLPGYRESSSLGTSVSGASVASEKEREKELQQHGEQGKTGVVQQQGLQRFRTLSAPQPQARTKPPLPLGLSGAGGVGSSPLTKLAGAAQERQPAEERKDDKEKTKAGVSTVHHTPHPHHLSRSSPPLGSPRTSDRSLLNQSPQPPNYVPDPRVFSSFPEFRATTVDYKEPRALHGALETPVSLSSFEEPIWEVVQDMREQRMSLCQSLRQYVFVHAAILEGALWIVDEQRERELVDLENENGSVAEVRQVNEHLSVSESTQARQSREREVGSRRRGVSPAPWSDDTSFRFTGDASSGGNSRSYHTPPQPSSSPSHVSRPYLPPLPIPQVPQFQRFNSNSSAGVSDSGSTSSTGKRGASPTELPKEDKKGEVLLSKRPSIKRKLRTPSPSVDAEKATGGEAVNANSPGTGSIAVGSPLQQVTVPSSPMPCE